MMKFKSPVAAIVVHFEFVRCVMLRMRLQKGYLFQNFRSYLVCVLQGIFCNVINRIVEILQGGFIPAYFSICHLPNLSTLPSPARGYNARLNPYVS